MQTLQIVKLVDFLDIVPFHIQNLQVFKLGYIEQIIDLIKRAIKFLKLFKSQYSLNFFEFTSCNMQYLKILETSAQVSERPDDRVIQFEFIQTWQDLSSDLQKVTLGVNSQLYLG